jgi:hypothetical protein
MSLSIQSCLVGFSLLAGLGCKEGQNVTKMQYMPDMADAPTAKTQETYIDPPEHSMPVRAVIYPEDWAVAEQEFRSPFRPGFGKYDKVLAKGEELYQTFCAVCHGDDGKGEGYLGTSYPIAVPDITRAELAERKDGFFFMKISKGGAMMPSYGHAIAPLERWQIVAHIRKLQNK